MKVTQQTLAQLAWDKMDNLLPAIVQDAVTGKVLMQGYMNQDALPTTLENRQVTFLRRCKPRCWTQGSPCGTNPISGDRSV